VGSGRVLVAAALCAASVGVAATASVSRGASHAARPNIVVIMTDDQTVESLRVMPTVRRELAREGTSFANSFVSFSLCCPSRATFLTGQYAHNHGVVGNNFTNGLSRFDETNTLPVWLKRVGYRTIFVGKYLNGYGVFRRKAIPRGWDDWHAAAKLAYFDYSLNENGKLVRYGHRPRDYQTDVLTRTALAALARPAAQRKPFFLWLAYWAPHEGNPRDRDDPPRLLTPSPAPRHRDLMYAQTLPHPASFDEGDVSDKPLDIQGRRLVTQNDLLAMTENYQQRLESLLAVDEGVAQLLDALRAGGRLDNTVIVFTSDNGFLQGEHRIRDGKVYLYEPSIRVPLIVRGPGVPRDTTLRQLVANIDLAPTIAALAGAKPTRIVDGRSLVPLFVHPRTHWARELLIERGPGGRAAFGERLFTAIRTQRYLYAEYLTGERELYDLRRDPDELQSRHGDPAYARVRDELARSLALLRDCAGATCAAAPPPLTR
jgi:N-acetylglucosamine-6-sulfatase